MNRPRLKTETVSTEKVANLTDGLLQSLRFAQLNTLQSLAVCNTTFMHMVMNCLDLSADEDVEENRALILEVLDKSRKRIVDWKRYENSSEDVPAIGLGGTAAH